MIDYLLLYHLYLLFLRNTKYNEMSFLTLRYNIKIQHLVILLFSNSEFIKQIRLFTLFTYVYL